MSEHPLFTVFTPTYNRSHTLPRVYKSLQQQVFKDFEWVIIDDENTDNTTELIKHWQTEMAFPIQFL